MRTSLIIVLVLCVWVALMPPFFTHGACTAEFDAVSEALQQARPGIGTLTQAQNYLASKAMAYQVLSAERCESSLPADVEVFGFNGAQQLVRIQTDMHPYRMLKLPALGLEVYWGR